MIVDGNKMRLCYVASGLQYTPSAGPSSHVISLVEALAKKEEVEVSLAFHGYREIPPLPMDKLDLCGIQAGDLVPRSSNRPDDVAVSGMDPRSYIGYIRRCRAFARRYTGRFDAVVERMWRVGGLVGAGLRSRGAVYVMEENGPPTWSRTGKPISDLTRWMLHHLSRGYARWAYARPHFIVVQTKELKQFLQNRFSVEPHRIRVIPNGVDALLFRPMDQRLCRLELALDADVLMLLFVGSLDEYHDLVPCMEAIAQLDDPRIQLHIVGAGVYRCAVDLAAARLKPGRCIFHGPVPHDRVPLWINAADICIAPYREEAFRESRFCFSPLKILEYMACGKPIISQPHSGIAQLIKNGEGGYLIANTSERWRERLASLPGREAMSAMGSVNARRALLHSWDAAADTYLEIIWEALP
jgi:glycosyltransferase involved in cell wall biosynthesis